MGAPGEKLGDDLYRAGTVIVSSNNLEVLALELQPEPEPANEVVEEAVA